ncbi:hypothetical protein [Saccharothrix sp. 6-C]|uniref:hypothetical protein n=1 Tax=Saccharothrix sp. 6-C TaxID=2781735 RepID=UPI003FA6950B
MTASVSALQRRRTTALNSRNQPLLSTHHTNLPLRALARRRRSGPSARSRQPCLQAWAWP